MKLSKETVNLFKNFASINTNLLLKPGNEVSTISGQKNVVSDTTVTENFPKDFGIYDLNEFLGALSLFEDPDLDFQDKYVVIKEGGSSIKFFAADPSVLTVPKNKINFPEADIEFTLTATMLNMISRTSSVLKVEDLQVVGDGSSINLQVGDKKNATGNSYSCFAGNTTKKFKANIKVDNLKMLPGDYIVTISNKKISRFKSTAGDLVYYVAVESDSSFE